MKTKQIFAALTVLSVLLFASIGHAQTFIQVTNSGNWSSTIPSQPWPSGILPTTNNIVEVLDNVILTNDMTNAACLALDSQIYGILQNGSVVMAPGSTLTVGGALEGYGSQTLGSLDATATNCTVIYAGNAFWATRTNFWNLVFSGWGDFYNGPQNGYNAQTMTIYGNFYVDGTNIPTDQTNGYTGCYVECGGWFNILGKLYIGQGSSFNCSTSVVEVMGPTIVDGGLLWDQAAGVGSNYFGGGLTILPNTNNLVLTNSRNALVQRFTNGENLTITGAYNPSKTNIYMGSMYMTDVSEWTIGGNFTNNGNVGFGTNYGSITFSGTGTNFGSTNYGAGVITGSNALHMPTMTIDGTYTVADNINLYTNYPTINGTVVFDLANTNQIILNAGTNAFWYSTNGTFDVINSGPPPVSGDTYQFFNDTSNLYGTTPYLTDNFPSLSAGLSWVNDLTNNGSIMVAGPVAGPVITSVRYNRATLAYTLTWTSVPGAMYTVQETPGLAPTAWSNLQTNIPSGGSTTTATVTMPAGTKGFLRILVQ